MSSSHTPNKGGASDWRSAGLLYHSLNWAFRQQFGGRVWKVSVDGGFGCPNADGTIAAEGCLFCNPESFSPSRRLCNQSTPPLSIAQQIQAGIHQLSQRGRAERFVAYFQPATNTYAPVDRLRSLFKEALAQPGIVGLAIGTRPDCVPDEVLDLMAELAQRTWLILELGLQSIHDRSLDWLRRGHHADAFFDAVQRADARRLQLGVHVVLGLPDETREDMHATARALARLPIHSIKIHNLYAVHDTPLAKLVERGEVVLPMRDEYAGWVADFLELLPPRCVIDRLSGDAPAKYLIAPAWCLDKTAVRSAIEEELRRRGTCQGGEVGRGLSLFFFPGRAYPEAEVWSGPDGRRSEPQGPPSRLVANSDRRKVRAPQDTVVGNSHRPQGQG